MKDLVRKKIIILIALICFTINVCSNPSYSAFWDRNKNQTQTQTQNTQNTNSQQTQTPQTNGQNET